MVEVVPSTSCSERICFPLWSLSLITNHILRSEKTSSLHIKLNLKPFILQFNQICHRGEMCSLFAIFSSVEWQVLTYIAVQTIGSIFKSRTAVNCLTVLLNATRGAVGLSFSFCSSSPWAPPKPFPILGVDCVLCGVPNTAVSKPDCERLRWSRGSVLAFGTQVRGFKPGRSLLIFQDEKFLSTPSFGGEVMPSVPCRRFTACKRSLNVTWKSGIFRQNSLAISPM